MKTSIVTAALCVVTAITYGQTTAHEGDRYTGYALASDVIGREVRNQQGEDIGDVGDLLIDARTGRIRFAVLGVGGFLGMAQTQVAVPWGAFTIKREGDTVRYTLDTTKERLQSAPRFDRQGVEQMYTREQAEPVYTYWRAIWMDDLTSPFPEPGITPAAVPEPGSTPGAGVTPAVPSAPGSTPSGAATPGDAKKPGSY